MKFPRLTGCAFFTVVLLIAVAALAPQQLPVSLYKLSLVSMAGLAGYWIDRELFPYARPDTFITIHRVANRLGQDVDTSIPVFDEVDAVVFAASLIRRAIIVGSAMLAIGLGA